MFQYYGSPILYLSLKKEGDAASDFRIINSRQKILYLHILLLHPKENKNVFILFLNAGKLTARDR